MRQYRQTWQKGVLEILGRTDCSDGNTMDWIKKAIQGALSPLHLKLVRFDPEPACSLEWIEEAQRDGMAVNDFIEKDHNKPALAELEALVFPRITPEAVVCELGPGTGVYTRYLNDYIRGGELHVVDFDPNAIAFLRRHLTKNPGTRLYQDSGTALPFEASQFVDLAFGASVFTGGNLSYFFRCVQEFQRVLKPGGHLVFDYFDISSEAGWEVLTKNMARKNPIFAYTYHSAETVQKVLEQLEFRVVDFCPSVRGSVFVTAQKR